MGIGKTRNLMWFVFPRSPLFSKKKRGNQFSGSRGQNHRKLILKISTINLHGAGKLKRREKDRLFLLPPFSLLRDSSFQNTSEHFAIRFRQSYLIWEVCDVTAIELSSKE